MKGKGENPTEKTRSDREKPRTRKSSGEDVSESFPIVGIGASAGGLDALNELFKNISGNPGLGFVVVQHLAPGKTSSLTEILQRSTSMVIQQAKDGQPVLQDNIYIIPQGKTMAILHGKLQLFEQADAPGHIHHPLIPFWSR
jgi:two-component system CheB/CheR fusion protein